MSPGDILRHTRTIALVGASQKEWRPSHSVMRYLLGQGYDVVPVNPVCAGEEILGRTVVGSLAEIEAPIDLVDVFRRAEHTPEVALQAVARGAKVLWLQEGIVNDDARRIGEEAGLTVIMGVCIKKQRQRLEGGSGA